MMAENGANRQQISAKDSTFLIAMNIVNMFTHLLLGAVSIGAIIHANVFYGLSVPGRNSLHQHIYLCVIGYVVLMSQAILSISPYNGWASTFNFKQRRTIHWVMQICGSTLAIAGSCLRMVNVNSHFSTAHGAFGILALVFTCLSFLGGIVNLFSSKVNLNPRIIKICHACLGSLTLVCAFLCLIFGFDKNMLAQRTNADMLISLTVFALLGTLAPASLSLIRRIKN